MYKSSCLCGIMFRYKYLDLYTRLYGMSQKGYGMLIYSLIHSTTQVYCKNRKFIHWGNKKHFKVVKTHYITCTVYLPIEARYPIEAHPLFREQKLHANVYICNKIDWLSNQKNILVQKIFFVFVVCPFVHISTYCTCIGIYSKVI